ncbi:alpha/beta fold hydrolase [Nocardia sp. NPDC101769]|uniref:alpha/beta fold hydrolase n=1 Tax=Nocardia sp. NPDC101769 TaxID=3364333 RepID=UPI003828DD1F
MLLLLPGGDGDADTYDQLAGHLEPHFSVVTYDRRGLSRSTCTGAAPTVATHADDAAAVLAAVTDTPAFVFGSSIGAVIALELTTRHPDVVQRTVVHEPPLAALLPEPARTELRQAQSAIEQAHRDHGIAAATGQFARLIQIDPTDHEPGIEPVRPGPERVANLNFFLTHDAPAVRQYQPDTLALQKQADTIIPAVGTTTTGQVPACTHALAELLDVEVTRLPGGHTAPTMHPRGVADTLHAILTGS